MQKDTTFEVDDVEPSAESADAERDDAEPCAESAEAERDDRLEELVLRSTKLDAREAAELRARFPDIVRAHQQVLEAWLRTQGLQDADEEIFLRESFEELFLFILENGFPANLGGELHSIAEGRVSNYRRRKGREPFSYRAVSSRSAPGSTPAEYGRCPLRARPAAARVRRE